MKFGYSKPQSYEYYTEIYYILSKFKKYNKNPNRKTHNIINYYLLIIVLSFLLIIYCTYCFYIFKDNLFIFLGGLYSFIILGLIFNLFKYKKIIKTSTTRNIKREITINDKAIEYMDCDKTYRVKWENVHYILFNKYSVVFLPYDITSPIITLPIEEKENILNLLNEYKLEDKLIITCEI